jgi:hypothetical protein
MVQKKIRLKEGEIRYGYSFPRWELEKVIPIAKKEAPTLRKAAQLIEYVFAPGHTSEPYVQLVEIKKVEGKIRYAVVTEWVPHERRWLSPLQAAGFEPLGAGQGYVRRDVYERIKRASQQHSQLP